MNYKNKKIVILFSIIMFYLLLMPQTIKAEDVSYKSNTTIHYSHTDIWAEGTNTNNTDKSVTLFKVMMTEKGDISTAIATTITKNGPKDSETAIVPFVLPSIKDYVSQNISLPKFQIQTPILDTVNDKWIIERIDLSSSSITVYTGITTYNNGNPKFNDSSTFGTFQIYDKITNGLAWIDTNPENTVTRNLSQTSEPYTGIYWSNMEYNLEAYTRYVHVAVKTITGKTISEVIEIPATPQYSVSYDMNGGEGTIEKTTTWTHKNSTVSSTIPTRANYRFVGWNTSPDGKGTSYNPGDIINARNDNIVLYAQWENNITQKQINIIWNDNSNIYSTRPQTLNVSIYQNGKEFTTVSLGFSQSNTWAKIINVPILDEKGNSYIYSIREDENNKNLQNFYIKPTYEQDTLTVTNTATFIPQQTKTHSEYKIVLHQDLVYKADWGITLTNKENFDKIGLNYKDNYNFVITLKQLNRIVTNNGDKLIESYEGYSGKEINGIISSNGNLTFNLGPDGYGKYEISETGSKYFNFLSLIGSANDMNTQGAILTEENGKYYITLSGITGQYEELHSLITSEIVSERFYYEFQSSQNLIKIIK